MSNLPHRPSPRFRRLIRAAGRWLRACREPRVLRRAVRLGFAVGALQALLNQGDLWFRQEVTLLVIAKTILSPLLSFSIALLSGAASHLEPPSASSSAS